MPYAHINDLKVYYEVHGEGEPLLLLSGMTMNYMPWTLYQIPTFTEAGYKVIVVDNRDVGRTAESDIENYKIRTLTDDTSGLLKHIGIESAHVLGYSMGGMIALDLAINYPSLVRSITVVGSTAKQGAFEANLLAVVKAAKEKLSNEEFWRFMGSKVMSWKFFENDEAVARWLGFVTSDAYYQSVSALKRQADACVGFDVLNELKNIDIPTFVVVGDKDEMLSPRHSELIAENIKGALFNSVPDMGHAVYSEGAEVFNPLVLNFLKSVRF